MIKIYINFWLAQPDWAFTAEFKNKKVMAGVLAGGIAGPGAINIVLAGGLWLIKVFTADWRQIWAMIPGSI